MTGKIKMKKLALISFYLLIEVTCIHAQQKDFPTPTDLSIGMEEIHIDPRFQGLDRIIKNILEEWNIPGCAVVIVEKNEVLFSGGFGYRELRSKSLVDEHTIFPIASCTKAFTASLIGILVDEGKIDIDKPANSFLPIIKFSDPLLTLQVTPRDMLTHRTGIPLHDCSWFGFENTSRDSLVQLIQYFPRSAGLREKFQYSNYMYVALGAMAEHIEQGKSWEEQIKDRFFIPLEMNSSSAMEEHLKTENAAYGHEVAFDMQPVEVHLYPPKTWLPVDQLIVMSKIFQNG